MPHWCSDPLKKALWPFKISWVSKDKVLVDKLCHLQSLILECFPVMGQRNSRPVRGFFYDAPGSLDSEQFKL